MNRRKFLEAACAAGGLLPSRNGSLLLPFAAAESTRPTRPLGDPYKPAGNRIVFTNWHWIRPASNATSRWYTSNDKKCGVGDQLGPDECTLQLRNVPFGIHLRAQPAQRMGPLVPGAGPDGGGVTINTMIQEQGMYRGWSVPWVYNGYPPGSKYSYYWESSDGLTWKRPDLGLYEVNGSRANNVLDVFGLDGASVFVDPAGPATERYKMLAGAVYNPDVVQSFLRSRPETVASYLFPDKPAHGIVGSVSADGLHWRRLPEPLSLETSDTQVVGYFDKDLQKYVIYTRKMSLAPRPLGVAAETAGAGGGRRVIGRAESADFRRFPVSTRVLEAGPDMPPSDVFYSSGRTSIPGAPDHHLMFPVVWHMDDDSTSIGIASSPDGTNWHVLPGSPILDTGPADAFDGGCVFSHPNLLELPDGSFALPYTGYSVTHKYPRGKWSFSAAYAVWPKGRLVALEAPEHGEFSTMRIQAPGRKLRLNVATARAGYVRVEVVGPDGKTVPGRSFAESIPIYGDHAKGAVHWGEQEDLGHPEGAAFALRFQVYKARIFGLEFV